MENLLPTQSQEAEMFLPHAAPALRQQARRSAQCSRHLPANLTYTLATQPLANVALFASPHSTRKMSGMGRLPVLEGDLPRSRLILSRAAPKPAVATSA